MAVRSLPFINKASAQGIWRWLDIFVLLAIVFGIASGVAIVLVGQPILVLFALGGLAVFIGAVVSAEFGLLILVFIMYTRISDILVHNYDAPSIAKFYVPLLVVTILVRWVFNREAPLGWQKLTIFLIVYGLVGFASMLYAPDTTRVINALEVFLKDAIIAIIVVSLLSTPDTFRRVVWTLLFIGIFLGTISIYQYLTGTYNNDYWGFALANIQNIKGETNDYRTAGPIGDPNYYAQIMGVMVPLALERVFRERNPILKGVALWALVASLFAVFLTYSRGGFLAVSVAVIAYFVFYPPKIIYIPIALLGGILLFSLAPPNYFDRILSLGELFNPQGGMMVEDVALRGRASENLAALEMVKSQPLFGVGFSNYSLLFNQYSKQAGLALVATERAAHNLYLEVVAETGLVGLAVFMSMLYIGLKTVFNAWKIFVKTKSHEFAGMAASFGVAFLGYLVAAFFIHNAYPRYFYLMLGLAFSFEVVARTHVETVRRKMLASQRKDASRTEADAMPERKPQSPAVAQSPFRMQ